MATESKVKSVNATLVNTEGITVGMLSALEKNFSTGSRGYYANGKLVIDGKMYQSMLTLVEIGSKPVSK